MCKNINDNIKELLRIIKNIEIYQWKKQHLFPKMITIVLLEMDWAIKIMNNDIFLRKILLIMIYEILLNILLMKNFINNLIK